MQQCHLCVPWAGEYRSGYVYAAEGPEELEAGQQLPRQQKQAMMQETGSEAARPQVMQMLASPAQAEKRSRAWRA